ncbi:MAG TPA: MarR family winged helix-turn-helix transcriptional regulator [Solirubrobacteraceae bacterium]|nr:MarR family winged helix-turn-helix transcriptional regulator [Solirubrobacteraceae bacterium]
MTTNATAKQSPKPRSAPKPAVAPKPASAPEPAIAPAAELSPELTELGHAFRHVFRTLSRLRGRDTHLGGSELSHAQFELLIELDERGELPAGELAAAARLTPATVTQMLDHLAACGHVERVRSETDRRVVVSRLTTQGANKIAAKRATWQGRWLEALDGVAARDLRTTTRVLERLGAMFEEGPPTGGCEALEKAPQEGSQAPN